jgi:hypothetical protein
MGKATVAEALRHSLSGGGHISYGVCGIDLDQLLENIVRELPGLIVQLRENSKWKQKSKTKRQLQFEQGLSLLNYLRYAVTSPNGIVLATRATSMK